MPLCMLPQQSKMIDLRHFLVVLLAGLPAAMGIPWPGPAQTVDGGSFNPGWTGTPLPTDRPRLIPVGMELNRDITVSPNTCGWVDGNLGEPWALITGRTCFWYSDRSIVNGWATCIDYGETLSGSLVNTCNAVSPYCGSVYFPSGYRAYGNCNPGQGSTYSIALTYSGQIDLVDLPIYTGSDGISTGTQTPPGASTSATNSVAIVTVTGSEALTTSTGSTSSSSSSSNTLSHSSTPVGPIVGGVIGGLAVICGTVVAIVWILRRSKQKNGGPAPMFQDQPHNDGLHELAQPYSAPRAELENSQAHGFGVEKGKMYVYHPVGAELDG